MISNAGSRRWPMPLTAGLALVFGLGLAAASQPALADVNEAEADLSLRGSEAALLPEAQLGDEGLRSGTKADTPVIVADKNKNKNKNWTKNYKYNKNYFVTKKIYVQPWSRKNYYGQFFGGVVLGSILTAAGVGVAPPPPAPELCWYWIDPYRSRGYWDYCPGYPY